MSDRLKKVAYMVVSITTVCLLLPTCTVATPQDSPPEDLSAVVNFQESEDLNQFFIMLDAHIRDALARPGCSEIFDDKFLELTESAKLRWVPSLPPGLHQALGATICPDVGTPRITMSLHWSSFVGPYITTKTVFHELLHVKMCYSDISSAKQEKIIDKELLACFPEKPKR